MPAFGAVFFRSFFREGFSDALLKGRCRFSPINANLVSMAVAALNDSCLLPDGGHAKKPVAIGTICGGDERFSPRTFQHVRRKILL